MKKNVVRITESELKRIVNESVNRILNERRDKITPKTFNIDGVDYESTNKIKGGGAWHPGFRFKDHESHNPNKLKSYRKRKDGYRYAQSYAGRPDDLHKHLTSEGKINEDDFKPNGVLYGLQSLSGRELFDRISNYLERLGDVKVSNFYSDDQNVVVAAHKSERGRRSEIDEIMFNFGYKLYDVGANGEYIYYTYKKGYNIN